jgi:hypothetical protein
MATHIDSVRGSAIPKVDKATLYSMCKGGDLVFCWGSARISKAIEAVAGGPSHVLMIWTPWPGAPWMTLEATFPSATESKSGVHLGLFSDYVDGYDGDLVLCRRPGLTQQQILDELNVGFTLLDDNYDWQEEVSIAARKLIPFAPVIKPKNELYCSGLQEAIAVNTIPFKTYGPDWNTPEQDFIDPSVETVCALLQGKV